MKLIKETCNFTVKCISQVNEPICLILAQGQHCFRASVRNDENGHGVDVYISPPWMRGVRQNPEYCAQSLQRL